MFILYGKFELFSYIGSRMAILEWLLKCLCVCVCVYIYIYIYDRYNSVLYIAISIRNVYNHWLISQ